MFRLAFVVTAALAALAAGPPRAAADTKVAYACTDGTIVVADFGMTRGRVLLTFKHRRVVLSPVEAAAGAKYTNDKTTFWTRDGAARLRDNGKETDCRVIEQ